MGRGCMGSGWDEEKTAFRSPAGEGAQVVSVPMLIAHPIRVHADQVRYHDSGYLQRHRFHHLQIRPDELRGRVEA